HLFTLDGGALFTIAGLWESWEREGRRIESVCLLTTEANELVRAVHDRMPVILPPEARQDWLRPGCNIEELRPLLRPYPASAMDCRPVSQAVNSALNKGPMCIEPAGPAQQSLF